MFLCIIASPEIRNFDKFKSSILHIILIKVIFSLTSTPERIRANMVPETGSSHGVTGKKASQGKASSLQCGIKSLRGCGTMRMFTLNLALLFVMQIAFATYVIGSSR